MSLLFMVSCSLQLPEEWDRSPGVKTVVPGVLHTTILAPCARRTTLFSLTYNAWTTKRKWWPLLGERREWGLLSQKGDLTTGLP